MRTYNDHEIEFWGEVFQACRLVGEGVSFEEFLAEPQATLQSFGMDDAVEVMASGFLPLLPRQARVRARLEQPASYCMSVHGQVVPLRPLTQSEIFTKRPMGGIVHTQVAA